MSLVAILPFLIIFIAIPNFVLSLFLPLRLIQQSLKSCLSMELEVVFIGIHFIFTGKNDL